MLVTITVVVGSGCPADAPAAVLLGTDLALISTWVPVTVWLIESTLET